MNIVILDNDENTLQEIERLIRKVFNDIQNISLLKSEEDLISNLKNRIDLLFIDIKLANINGIDLVKKYRMELKKTKIIYITGYDYIEDVFETNPFYYLEKPITEEKLWKIEKKLDMEKEILNVHFNKEIRKVFVNEIRYLNSYSRLVLLNIIDGNIIKTYDTLDNIVRLLPDNFVRIHKSFVVNLDYVKSYRKGEILLDNDIKLNISRNYRKKVESAIINYVRSDINV